MYGFIDALIFFIFFSIEISHEHLSSHIYCRDKNRLITTEKLDEYLLVDAEINTTLRLECHFCNEVNDNQQQKLWFFQDRFQENAESELQIGMNNNMSMNKIHLNSLSDVIIQDFDSSNAGIYRCHGIQGQNIENKFNYRLEPVFEQSEFINLQRGNISDWEVYRQINLIPVTNRFAVSPMSNLSRIRNFGVILEVISEWSEWSPCEECIKKMGIKTSKARCRLKSSIKNHPLSHSETSEINFFIKSPILPCRSQLLYEKFPIISNAIKNLPEFILEKTCNNCKRIKKTKINKFKYNKRYTLAIGSYLAIICPESDMKSHIIWRKEKTILKIGRGQSFDENEQKNHILIDTFSTLYLKNVSEKETGNYTCYVDDIKMMQIKVTVVPKSTLITEALLRHMGYLGFILFIVLFCYCAGIIYAWKNPAEYAQKDYKMILEEMKAEEQKRLLEY